jgi:hypothetical protein
MSLNQRGTLRITILCLTKTKKWIPSVKKGQMVHIMAQEILLVNLQEIFLVNLKQTGIAEVILAHNNVVKSLDNSLQNVHLEEGTFLLLFPPTVINQ